METDTPFFIFALPRCRTAWLSCIATMAGASCTHEGVRDFESFDAYAEGRLTGGDSDPTLCFWTPQILERWPDARFVVIERNDADSLVSMLKATPDADREAIAAGWHSVSAAFSVTRDLMRGNPNVLFCSFDDLRSNHVVAAILAHIGVTSLPSDEMLTKWQRLNIQCYIESGAVSPKLEVQSSNRVRAGDVCGISGLSAVMYERENYNEVAEWWRIHTGQHLQESALPPLGVLVSNESGPLACVWCYECYGVPVAELVFPVTRPGLSVADARRSVLYAISCIIEAAGKGHVPEAAFTTFRANVPAGLTRFVERIGFRRGDSNKVPMILTL